MTEAGWHTDPQDPSQLRYWDGSQWTEHRSPNPQAAPQAAPQFAPPPASSYSTPPAYQTPAPQPFAPPPGFPQAVQPAKKSSKVWWVLGGILVVSVVLAGSCIALVGRGANDLADEFEKELEENEATVVDPPGGESPADGLVGDGSVDEGSSGGDGAAGTRDSPLPFGTEVDFGNGWRVTVVSADLSPGVNDLVAAANEFNSPPDPGMRYVMVNLSASFDGTDDTDLEAPLLGWSYSVFGSDNTERDGFGTFATAPDPAFDPIADLAAGGTAAGNVLVEVGESETGLVLRVAPLFSFDDTEGWFALE